MRSFLFITFAIASLLFIQVEAIKKRSLVRHIERRDSAAMLQHPKAAMENYREMTANSPDSQPYFPPPPAQFMQTSPGTWAPSAGTDTEPQDDSGAVIIEEEDVQLEQLDDEDDEYDPEEDR
ncbi:MAG: hypothetical protein EXX96DRAFT_616167 [Benjaminiella poitrasii]|nr:MAG: hypothetical protein EXX96DRAFT_616167 [Benjaminiella poitrasii]